MERTNYSFRLGNRGGTSVEDLYSGSPGAPAAWMEQFKQMIRGLDKDLARRRTSSEWLSYTVQIGIGAKSALTFFMAFWSRASTISDHGTAPMVLTCCALIYRALSRRTGPIVGERTLSGRRCTWSGNFAEWRKSNTPKIV